jgi:hypothetical protein
MTTTRLKLASGARAWYDLPTPLAIGVCVFSLFLIAGLAGRITRAPVAAVQPTPGLVILIATAQPVAVPLVEHAQIVQDAPARYVTAWAAPDGVVLGPIPWSADSPMLGRYGDNWVLTSWDNGQVWVRASDIGLNLANLAPQIAPEMQVVYIQPETRQEAPVAPILPQPIDPPYQVANQPPAAPAALEIAPTAAPVPTAAPASQPLDHDTDIEREWIRRQLATEHPEWKNYP